MTATHFTSPVALHDRMQSTGEILRSKAKTWENDTHETFKQRAFGVGQVALDRASNSIDYGCNWLNEKGSFAADMASIVQAYVPKQISVRLSEK